MLSYKEYNKVINWVKKEGAHRGVTIEYDRYDHSVPKFSCWCWDFEAIAGFHFLPGEDLPTTQELKQMKKKELLEELEMI